MYAVAEIAGKQYILEEGKTIEVDRLNLADGSEVKIDKVCMIRDESGEVKVGAPYVSGAVVTAKVEKEVLGKKIVVFTYRKRKDSRRKKGHRQKYSRIKIESIKQA